MEIHVEFLTGKIITVYVEPSDTIQIVKMKIEEKEGIPPNKQSLMLGNNLLRDDRTLSFYKIRPDSLFHLIMKNHIWDRLNFMYSEKASKIRKISHLLDFTLSKFKYRMHAIISRSWFEAALVYKPRILSLKNEKFPFLVHKLSAI